MALLLADPTAEQGSAATTGPPDSAGVAPPGPDEIWIGENDCGITALAVCLALIDRPVPLARLAALVRGCRAPSEHLSMHDLMDASRRAGASAVAAQWDGSIPPAVPGPAIIIIANRRSRAHFVALARYGTDGALLVDDPARLVHVPWAELRGMGWDGTALHLLPSNADVARVRCEVFLARHGTPLTGAAAGFALWCAGTVVAGRLQRRRTRAPFVCRQARQAAARSSRYRNGVSAIELLVVMAIIGLLVSLIAPALMSARESSRRVRCQNNLRQIMLACTNHHAAHTRFPASLVPYTDFTSRPPLRHNRNASMFVALLPYLDQAALYQKFNNDEDGLGVSADPATSALNADLLDAAIAVFHCPSDDARGGATNYRGCVGTGPDLYSTTPLGPNAARRGAFSFMPIRDGDVRDGLSQTVFFSERVVGDRDRGRYTPARDIHLKSLNVLYPDDVAGACALAAAQGPEHLSFAGSTWVLSGLHTTWYNHALGPNAATPDCGGRGTFRSVGAVSARSWHPGGVLCAFGDGAVKFIGASVAIDVWRASSSIAGEEALEIP